MAADNPLVTVLMPVYNGEKYLRDSIESILTQTLRDFEFWIINDNSSDDTQAILDSYKDPRIRLFRNDSTLGVAATLNKYFHSTRSVYIARMDSDDVSSPERLERQVRFLNANPEVGVCGTWIKLFGDAKNTIRYPELHDLIKIDMLFSCPVAHPTVMIRQSAVDGIDPLYRTDFAAAQDYELWSRLIASVRFSNLQEVLLSYRTHEDQVGFYKREKQESAAQYVRLEQLRKLGLNPTGKETAIHEMISTGKYERSIDFAMKAHSWMRGIYEANERAGIYERGELSRYLGRRLYLICRKIRRSNLQLYSMFSDSPFSIHVGARYKLYLLLRCGLGI